MNPTTLAARRFPSHLAALPGQPVVTVRLSSSSVRLKEPVHGGGFSSRMPPPNPTRYDAG